MRKKKLKLFEEDFINLVLMTCPVDIVFLPMLNQSLVSLYLSLLTVSNSFSSSLVLSFSQQNLILQKHSS